MSAESSEPSERDKIPVAISVIDHHHFEDQAFHAVVDDIMSGVEYGEQQLRSLYTNGRAVRLFYNSGKPRPARWLGFFKSALADNQAMLGAHNRVASFVCFIGSGDRTFVVTGGSGKFVVQDYLDPNFGMDILVRLIQKDAPSVRSLQDRGVAGAVLGESRFFRGRQRLTDEDQFGKIYKEINAILNKATLLRELGFGEKELKGKSVGAWAKASFLLSKSFDFIRMLSIVDRLYTILQKDANFSLNNVLLIRNRGENNRILINRLNEQLKINLYEGCLDGQIPDFDFCHWEFETYLTASSFRVEIDGEDDLVSGRPIELKELIRHFKDKDRWTADSAEEFYYGILRRRILSYDDKEQEETSGLVMEHFHGEVALDGRKYFYLDRQWYQVENAFISALNNQCQALINQYHDATLLTKAYDIKKEERDFTDQYLACPGCLILDTITAEHIEACDLLIHQDDAVYLVHVKRGFNNSMRELAAQVSLAARRLAQDVLSDQSYMAAIEDQARSGHSSASLRLQNIARQTFPVGGLAALFKGRKLGKIVFCLAFADKSDNIRDIRTEIARFDSNVAKHSLIQLVQEVRKHGFDFKIIQLQKPS